MGTSRRVLVVDDDRSMVRTLADVLRFKGWTVVTAHNGIEAVNIAAREDFSAVVMDYKMPGTDGVSAYHAIRSFRPHTRVILMSAYIAPDVAAEAQRSGVMRVMSKPVDINALLRHLNEGVATTRAILLVDTDTAFLRTMSELLALRGFDAVGATGVDDATRLLRERSPTAVLLHLHLRPGSARDLVLRVKQQSPSVALVVYSGQAGGEDEVRQWLPAGWIHAYLQKPFQVDQVTEALRGIAAA